MIIGLVGNAGVGKSTLARELKKLIDWDCADIRPFAQALRNEIKEASYVGSRIYNRDWFTKKDANLNIITGFNSVCDDTNLLYQKPLDPNIRLLLQWWGTDYRRKENPYYWIQQWTQGIDFDNDTIIDDIRFENEANIIKALGGVVIRLYRNTPTIAPDHSSESIDVWWNSSDIDVWEFQLTADTKADAMRLLELVKNINRN